MGDPEIPETIDVMGGMAAPRVQRQRRAVDKPMVSLLLGIFLTTGAGAFIGMIAYIHSSDLAALNATDAESREVHLLQARALAEDRSRIVALETRMDSFERAQQQVLTKQDILLDNQRKILSALRLQTSGR